jgi:uncharacterized protein (DUF697 family)
MLNAIKQARAAFSLLSPGDIRDSASRPVTIGLVAAGERDYAEMERFLAPDAAIEAAPEAETLVYRAGAPDVPNQVDLVLYEDGLFGPKGTFTFDRSDPHRTVEEIVRENDELALALARRYPVFRKHVVERTIHAVARENAFFAIASALPDVIPSIIELPWAFGEFASDTIFMTVNQTRMAFLIAAASGKEIGFAAQKAEIAAIAAGAFGWRAIARELVGHIPFGAGLIPKASIAYAVTYALGKGLEKLHLTGVPHTHDESRAVYQRALEQGKNVAGQFRPELGSADAQ